MSDYSYATQRKIKHLAEHFGPNWKDQIGNHSIDSAYNALVGDTRKNVFAKLPVETKARLDEMVKSNQVQMADFLTTIIEEKYAQFCARRDLIENALRKEFSGG